MTLDGRRITRLHAMILMGLTLILTFGVFLGRTAGIGPYSGLRENTMAIVGYVQAYPLMGLVAFAMFMGVQGPRPWRFSALGILAHLIPLATLWVFWSPLLQSPIVSAIPLSFLIHGTGIAAELSALRLGYGASG